MGVKVNTIKDVRQCQPDLPNTGNPNQINKAASNSKPGKLQNQIHRKISELGGGSGPRPILYEINGTESSIAQGDLSSLALNIGLIAFYACQGQYIQLKAGISPSYSFGYALSMSMGNQALNNSSRNELNQQSNTNYVSQNNGGSHHAINHSIGQCGSPGSNGGRSLKNYNN